MRHRTAPPSVTAMNAAQNPVALVPGASRGLGRVLASGLAKDGYALIMDARDPAVLDGAVAALPAGTRVWALPGDVTDPAHRDALHGAVTEAGGLDLLVNNAGTLGARPLPPLAPYPLDPLPAPFGAHVIAPIPLIQLPLPTLRERGGALPTTPADA